MDTFGARLKELMGRRGTSRNALASAVGRNQCVVSMWMNNHSQPKLDSIQEVADALRLTDAEIVWLVMGGRNAL
jgi:transcriptional regulator with XRE-family HTH domain